MDKIPSPERDVAQDLATLETGNQLLASSVPSLEKHLMEKPDDLDQRLQLMGFYKINDVEDDYKELYLYHLLWLINNKPTLSIFSYVSCTDCATDYRRVLQAWLRQIKAHPESDIVLHHAAKFFSGKKNRMAEILWRRAESLDPCNEIYPRELSFLFSAKARTDDPIKQKCYASKAFEEYDKAAKLHEKDSSSAYLDIYKESILCDMADLALKSSFLDRAQEYGKTLIKIVPFQEVSRSLEGKEIRTTKFRFAAHRGHSILGRTALKEKKIADAVEHLKVMTTLPLPESFDTVLAAELLDFHERWTVIDYLNYCKEQITAYVNRLTPTNLPIDSLEFAALERAKQQGVDPTTFLKQWSKPLERRLAKLVDCIVAVNEHKVPSFDQ